MTETLRFSVDIWFGMWYTPTVKKLGWSSIVRIAFQESCRWWEDGNAPCEKNTPEPAEEPPFGEVDPPVMLR